MLRNPLIYITAVLTCIACSKEDEAGWSPGDPLSALMTKEQRLQVESFEEARKRYRELTPDEFSQDYGPTANYVDGIEFDPLEAHDLDRIQEVVPITEEQKSLYRSKGFVVLDSVKYPNFLDAFVRIYSDDLPVYFSVDAMLEAIHLSFDKILMQLEVYVLSGLLDTMLDKMEQALLEIGKHESEVEDSDVALTLDDAAVWLCVASSLLNGQRQSCQRDVDTEVSELLRLIAKRAPETIVLFGKEVEEDFSQFTPRGHYTEMDQQRHPFNVYEKDSLEDYFNTMIWVQRIGLDIKDNKRHALLAYLLSDLLHKGGGTDEYKTINRVLEAFVGVSDSMNAIELMAIVDKTGLKSVEMLNEPDTMDAFISETLEASVANQRINSAILMSDFSLGPDAFTPIPPMYHFMGQRFIVDSYIFQNVVFDRVKEPEPRYIPSPLDTWFVLGNKETIPLLKDEIDRYQYQANLATLKYLLDTYDEAFWNKNFYNGWLSALMTLDDDTTSKSYPPVMRTRTWQQRMLNTQLASWSHLRHDTILYAKSTYGSTICEYPDAWVDPYPTFFQTIAELAESVRTSLDSAGVPASRPESESDNFGSSVQTAIATYFSRLAEIALMLKDIVDAELEQTSLTDAQLHFMNQMIFDDGDSGDPPYDGWYMDLIYQPSKEFGMFDFEQVLEFNPTVADIHTDPNTGSILHVATGYPNPMLIAIETDCRLSAYIGPVLSYHETVEKSYTRLDDATWKARLEVGEASRPDWTRSFLR